jgi:hypothetical protein
MSDTEQEVKKSISSIYASLLQKREEKRERKAEKKRLKKEEESLEEAGSTEETPMTKKEKRQAKIDAWKEVIIGLTGDDLDYVAPKKSKKKYRKWIDDEMENTILTEKPKKKKKRNCRKEFEPEINMLKNIVAEQNKFTVDLQKRYQHAAGPNTRDSMPLNKTLVELASVINASRSNSLGLLREIGNIKKTIADLYMKQFKLDQDSKGDGFDSQDLGLMGSSIASSLFGDSGANAVSSSLATQITPTTVSASPTVPTGPTNTVVATAAPQMVFPKFDPATWDGDGISSGNAKFEAIPHTVVVEVHQDSQKARFKAVRNDTGEELMGAPVPTGTIKAIDLKTKIAKDDFDQVYPIELVG